MYFEISSFLRFDSRTTINNETATAYTLTYEITHFKQPPSALGLFICVKSDIYFKINHIWMCLQAF